jgi:beta-xylosidase
MLTATTVLADKPAPWIADLGDGRYKNPVLCADYSDPDAIRVGEDYYLTASSFLATPGLPILHSRDLVNWTLINHALPRQVPAEHFAKVRHGQGVWAPALRFHAGRYYIYYPDPDFGLYMVSATDPAGSWSEPVLVKAGKGLIDPCPFWDEDGRLYLIHGWAKSRSGIANLLTLLELSPDGTRPLNEGSVIIDANKLPGWHTLEGPKLYKRNGYYYVFAPAGGVTGGYQAVFRSKAITGPYDVKIVLAQGNSSVNGPHQGAWVDTGTGEDWFLHFQDRGIFGRVVHLQPMEWKGDWPVIGADPDEDGTGEPYLTHQKPKTSASQSIEAPATSDEFDSPKLGLQWQWNANPDTSWFSLTERASALRLSCVPRPSQRTDGSPAGKSLYDAPNFLLQKFPAPAFVATTMLDFFPLADGDLAGLAVFGFNYAILGLKQEGSQRQLVLLVAERAEKAGVEHRECARIELPPSGPVYLRVAVDEKAQCRFSWSLDNHAFQNIGDPVQASEDRWVGARLGLIATTRPGTKPTGHADFDWFHVTAP